MSKLKVGIVFGCFIPLHQGHMFMIQRACDENDFVIIGVTGYDMDRGRDFIPFLRRMRLMREVYGKSGRVLLSEVDDRKIGLTGTFSESAWRAWCAELFRNTGAEGTNPDDPGAVFTWYTGEDAYIEKIKAIYPHHEFIKLDRSFIPISGTAIRENPERYRDVIHPVFIEYLAKNHLKTEAKGE